MFSRSTVVPMLFHQEHLLHFELDCDTLTLSALTKAYHRRALADHPDKGGQKEIFQETKDLYDNLMRNLEELVKIQAEKPQVTVADVTCFSQRPAKKGRQEAKPKVAVAPPWHATTILQEPFGQIEEALIWLAPYLLKDSVSVLAARLRDLQIGQSHTTELLVVQRCVQPPATTVAVKYHGTSWSGCKAILLDGFKPSFGAGAPPDTPLVYTSGRERTAWRYPQALCDEHWEACGEVVADDTYCLRLCLTCNVNAHERVVKIRRRRGNFQDAYPENAVWATHVTFRAMATAPPEQLAERRPKQPEAPPFEPRGVWASSVSSDDDQRGGVWASPVSSATNQAT